MRVIAILIAILILQVSVGMGWADVHVRDGDTIVVTDVPVRLEGLHCPELKAPGGQAAKQLMQAVVDSGPAITCQLSGAKSYDREIGYCQASGVDLGIIMIQSGHCQPCRAYDRLNKYDGFPMPGPVPAYCK